MNRKIYCANGSFGYASWVLPLGIEITRNPEDADILLLEGGQDIDFRLYSKFRGRHTGSPGERDVRELALYKEFNREGKYMLGICRGAQYCCAMQPGGALIQDMSHPHYHNITTREGHILSCPSLHHQSQLLTNIPPENYELVAWAERLSPYHLDGEDKQIDLPMNFKEPEIVIYNNSQVCIQSHPEMAHINSKFVQYCQNLMRKYILNEPEVELQNEGIGRNRSSYQEKEEDSYHWTSWL